MNLSHEKKITMVEFDAVFSNEEKEKLLKYARQNILTDETALLNWAINDTCRKHVDKLQKNIDSLQRLKDNSAKATISMN